MSKGQLNMDVRGETKNASRRLAILKERKLNIFVSLLKYVDVLLCQCVISLLCGG